MMRKFVADSNPHLWQNTKILVVDDEESLCEILQFNLEVEGYEADVAYSAEQALRMHPERYSLILLDVMMGEMSGFRMAQLLKADPETARVPVIFCTAKDSEDDTVAGLNIGADDSHHQTLFRSAKCWPACAAYCAARPPHAPNPKASASKVWEIDLRRKVCTLDGKGAATHQEGVRNPGSAALEPGRDLFTRGDPAPHLERRGDRPRPHGRVNITRLRRKVGPYGDTS